MRALRLLSLAGLLLAAQSTLAQSPGNTTDLARQLQVLQQRLEAFDARLTRIEGAGQQNRQLLELLREVETLKEELAKLRGQTEMQAHQVMALGRRQNDLYVDLDERVAELARLAKPVAAAAPVAPPVAPPTVVAARPASPAQPAAAPQLDPLVESRTYEAALNHFREANYQAAIAGFSGFLKAYPESALAPNAHYWIGFSHHALRNHQTALEHQQRLVATFPDSSKVPDALLNIASNQIALDNLDAAKKTLEELIARHPGTQAATLASRRLAVLK